MWVSFSVPWTPHLAHTGSLHIWNYHYLSYRHSIFIKFCTIFLIGYQHSISILCFTIFLVNMTIHGHIMGKLGCLRSFLLWANCHNTNQFFADEELEMPFQELLMLLLMLMMMLMSRKTLTMADSFLKFWRRIGIASSQLGDSLIACNCC